MGESRCREVAGIPSLRLDQSDTEEALISMKAPHTFEEALESFWQEAKAVMLAKRRLRGHENITKQGLYGVVTRVVEDKMARIKRTVGDMHLREEMECRGIPQDVIDSLVPLPANEVDEELEDDFVDAANYFCIAWLLWQDWWALPLASELPEETGTRAGGMRVARGDLR